MRGTELKLPVSTLNVLGDRYRVRLCRMKAYGECHYWDGEIRLRPNQSPDQARDTLLHEVIHAICNVDSLELTENQVRRVATGLRAVFTSNPKFAKWVSS